jgi:hypothetical protein
VAASAQQRPTPSEVTSPAAEYVYALTWGTSAITAPSGGLGDAAVTSVRFRDLAALTSPVQSVPVRARRRELTRHSDVVAAAFRSGTVVPLSFGTIFPSREAVVDELLEPRYAELVRLLGELEGLCELRVTAIYQEPRILAEIVAHEPRIARLRDATRSRPEAATRGLRLELGEHVASALGAWAEADARAIVERVRSLARDSVVAERLTELEVVRASFLVDVAELGRFDAAMDDLARDHEGRMQFKYVGPLAPHSFVSLGEAA